MKGAACIAGDGSLVKLTTLPCGNRAQLKLEIIPVGGELAHSAVLLPDDAEMFADILRRLEPAFRKG